MLFVILSTEAFARSGGHSEDGGFSQRPAWLVDAPRFDVYNQMEDNGYGPNTMIDISSMGVSSKRPAPVTALRFQNNDNMLKAAPEDILPLSRNPRRPRKSSWTQTGFFPEAYPYAYENRLPPLIIHPPKWFTRLYENGESNWTPGVAMAPKWLTKWLENGESNWTPGVAMAPKWLTKFLENDENGWLPGAVAMAPKWITKWLENGENSLFPGVVTAPKWITKFLENDENALLGGLIVPPKWLTSMFKNEDNTLGKDYIKIDPKPFITRGFLEGKHGQVYNGATIRPRPEYTKPIIIPRHQDVYNHQDFVKDTIPSWVQRGAYPGTKRGSLAEENEKHYSSHQAFEAHETDLPYIKIEYPYPVYPGWLSDPKAPAEDDPEYNASDVNASNGKAQQGFDVYSRIPHQMGIPLYSPWTKPGGFPRKPQADPTYREYNQQDNFPPAFITPLFPAKIKDMLLGLGRETKDQEDPVYSGEGVNATNVTKFPKKKAQKGKRNFVSPFPPIYPEYNAFPGTRIERSDHTYMYPKYTKWSKKQTLYKPDPMYKESAGTMNGLLDEEPRLSVIGQGFLKIPGWGKPPYQTGQPEEGDPMYQEDKNEGSENVGLQSRPAVKSTLS